MADESESTVEDPDIQVPDADDLEVTDASSEIVEKIDETAPSIARTRGAIVSNLRAAFEQHGSKTTIPRPLSVDGRNLASNGRLSTFDADFARLKSAMAKEQAVRQADKLRLESQEAEIERLKAQVEHLESVNSAQMAEEEESEEGVDLQKEELVNALHDARSQVESTEAAANALRAQLVELKRSIATNTRIESHEMTDSAIQGELGVLCYQLQDWTINRFRKAKIDCTGEELVGRIPEDMKTDARTSLLLLFKGWDSRAKMAILQSASMTLLMPIFEAQMPFGLPSQAGWSEAIQAASRGLKEVLDVVAYNRWRATTFDIICHDEAMPPFVHSAANKVVAETCKVLDSVSATTTSEAQTDMLRNVVGRLIALSHSLRMQRALYEVRLPEPDTSFDAATMEEVSDEYDGPEERKIRCALFPLVAKSSSLGPVNIVFKARVC